MNNYPKCINTTLLTFFFVIAVISVINENSSIIYAEDPNTIPVGNGPGDMDINEVTNKIYVVNVDGTVSVIDGSTDTVINTISVGSFPREITINEVTNKIYVTNIDDDTVSVIDGSTDTVINTISVGSFPGELTINEVPNKIYVLNRSDDTVSVIDGSTDTVINTISVGNRSIELTINEVTNKIYVVNIDDDTVSVIDGSTDTVINTISVGNSPGGITINEVTNKIYVTNIDDDTVSVIDGSTDTVINTISVGNRPIELTINEVTNKIYVANQSDDTVSVIDGSTDTTDIIFLTDGSREITINEVTNLIYATNYIDNTVSVIDGSTNIAINTISVGNGPKQIAINEVTNKIYVANQFDDTVSVIDGSTSIITDPNIIRVVNGPSQITINEVTNKIYVTNIDDDTVSVIDGSTDTVVNIMPVGNGPSQITINEVTNKIYVANQFDDTVSVIDGSTDTVINTISVGNRPGELTINEVTNKIYVTNQSDDTVSVIDGSTDTVINTISVGNSPGGITINEVTNKIYVTNQSDDTVSVIDGSTDTVINTISVGNHPGGIAINEVTNKIYVLNAVDGSVSVIDGSTDTEVAITSVAPRPIELTINEVTNKIYVINFIGVISVIDGSTDTVGILPVGNHPGGIAINEVTNKIYVANQFDNSISIIDGSTNIIIDPNTMPVGNGPEDMDVNEVTNKIYVANQFDDTVSVIDGSTDTVINTISVGNRPGELTINEVTNKIYVANIDDDTVSVIDGSTDTVINTISVGNRPGGITINEVTNKIYVANIDDDTVSVIDGSTDTVINTISVGNRPGGIAINEVTNKIYVTNIDDDTVSVIDGSTDTVINTISVGSFPSGITINEVTNKIYVWAFDNDERTISTIHVIDGLTNVVIDTIFLDISISSDKITINETTNLIYVPNRLGDDIHIIDSLVDTVIDTITVKSFPSGIAINEVTNKIYVAKLSDNGISVTNLSSTPSIITDLTANGISKTEIQLIWTVPLNDGGSPITDYIVEFKESENTEFAIFDDGISISTNAIIDGLTMDISYDFRVTAVNSEGRGQESATVTSTPLIPITPSIEFDFDEYLIDSISEITINDESANLDDEFNDSVLFSVVSSSDGITNSTAFETSIDSGIFVQNIRLVEELSDPDLIPELIVSVGDTILASYNDISTTAEIVMDDTEDIVPPTINIPSSVITQETLTNSASVIYDVTASDDVDGDISVICDPLSGSDFFLGPTLVTCNAQDSADNMAEEIFVVFVNNPTKEPRDGAIGSIVGGIGLPDDLCEIDNDNELKNDDDVDGDGLCDSWELEGIGLFIINDDEPNKKAFYPCEDGLKNGCPSPNQLDIYIEIDYMPGYEPSDEALQSVIDIFEQNDIYLHIYKEENRPIEYHRDKIKIIDRLNASFTKIQIKSDFTKIKERSFGYEEELFGQFGEPSDVLFAKRQAFHYALFVNQITDRGLKDTTGLSDILGNDMVIALGSYFIMFGGLSDKEVAGTFMHELGHNLNLLHGGPNDDDDTTGTDQINCKPNYFSVMNYIYQIPIALPEEMWFLDFNPEPQSTLDEGSLNEAMGFLINATKTFPFYHIAYGPTINDDNDIGDIITHKKQSDVTGVPINWNWNFTESDIPIIEEGTLPLPVNLNFFGIRECDNASSDDQLIVDKSDWKHLKFNYRVNDVGFRDGLGGIGGEAELPTELSFADIDFLREKYEVSTPEANSFYEIPFGYPQTVKINGVFPVEITLKGGHHKNNPLDFLISMPPQHGTLSAPSPDGDFSAKVTYVPNPDFDGVDSFQFLTKEKNSENQGEPVIVILESSLSPSKHPFSPSISSQEN